MFKLNLKSSRVKKLTSIFLASSLLFGAAFFAGCSGEASSSVPLPAIEMKTGPEIQTELQKIGYKTATSFEASKTGPSFSILSNTNNIVVLSENCTVDEYIDKLLAGEKPSVCIAWKDGDTIYYFANGYTDKGNKIPLNPDSSKMFDAESYIPLTHLDLSGFDTSNVTNMSRMFYRLSSVETLDLSGFNTAKVTDMSYMFCAMDIKTLDLSSFNVKSLTNTENMFASNDTLERIYVKAGTDWNISANVTNSKNMFYYCNSLKGGNNYSYNGSRDITNARIAGLNGIEKGYFTDVKTKGVLQRIELDTTNVKKEYFKGTTLDTTGLSITAHFKDSYGTESTTTVVAGYETSYDFSTTGQKEVTVSYTKDGVTKTASYTVTVKDGYKVTVKHMQENLADSNYSLVEQEEFGFAPGTSFTPTAKSYEDFTTPTVSAQTINDNTTIELKYARKVCRLIFKATTTTTNGTMLQFDNSYASDIKKLPGIKSVTMKTLADTTIPTVIIAAKCGADLSKLTYNYYLKAKGYKFSSVQKPSGYNDSSNLDSDNYPKKAKADFDNTSWTIKWRLPTIYICDQDHGNNLSYYLRELGADESAVKFIPSATPKPSSVSASQVMQISTDYLPPNYNTRAEAKAYAWVEMDGVTPVIKYYAECGNASNKEGYPTLPYTDCRYMFTECKNLQEIDLSGFDLSNVTNMSYMFNKCTALKTVKFGKLDTSKVTTMREIFMQCENLTKFDQSGFVTSACTDMHCMFYDCYKLTSVNTSGWNTSNVTTMEALFFECGDLTTLDLSMFDMTNVTNIRWMFVRCTNLTTIYAKSGTNWGTKTWSESNAEAPFSGCNKLKGSQGTTYDSSVAGGSVSRAKIDGGSTSPGYFTAK
jgi:surface protein